MGKDITLSKKHGLNPSKVEDCAVLMKEADFNAVFNKH